MNKNPKLKKSPLLNNLHLLIQSLDPSQKRDFRKYIRLWGNKSKAYERMFHFFQETEKEPSGNQLRRKISEKNVVAAERSSDVGRYLYDKILDSLRRAPAHNQGFFRLLERMQDVQTLWQMELFDDCLALIRETKKLAARIDKPVLLLELLHMEKKVLVRINVSHVDSLLEVLQTQESICRAVIERNQLLNDLFMNISVRNRRSEPPPPDWAEKLTGLTTEPIDAFSRHNRILYFQIQTDYLRSRVRFAGKSEPGLLPFETYLQGAFENEKKIVALFEEEPVFMNEYEEQYLGSLDRFLSIALLTNRLQYFEEYEKSLRRFRKRLLYYRSFAYLYLFWYIKSKQFAAGCLYIEENRKQLEKQLIKYRPHIMASRLAVVDYACFQLYFIVENFAEAQRWLRKVRQLGETDIQVEIRVMTHILEVVVQYELGNFSRQENPDAAVEGLNRFLNRLGIKDTFLAFFLHTLNELLISGSTVTAGFPQAVARGGELLSDRRKDDPFYLLLWWLESRATGQRMRDLADKYL